MSEPIRELLQLFETLPDSDKQAAIIELLKRSPLGGDDISDADLDKLADELFTALDEEEDSRAAGR